MKLPLWVAVTLERLIGAACLVALSACYVHMDQAQLCAMRDAALSQATAAGVPVVLGSVGWTVHDGYEVGAVDLSICFSNTDAARTIQSATFHLTAYDQSGDTVVGRMDKAGEVQAEFEGSLGPGQTTEAEWLDVWRKQTPLPYANVAEVVVSRVEIAYSNGESGSLFIEP